MSDIHIEARLLTNPSAKTLVKSLRDYNNFDNLRFVDLEGTNIKQQLVLTDSTLELELETDNLLSVLFLLSTDVLVKVATFNVGRIAHLYEIIFVITIIWITWCEYILYAEVIPLLHF